MNIPAPENHTDVAGGDASQPARKRNIEALTAFFRSGIKPAGSHGKLGIELEQTIVRSDGSPVSYSEENGVAHLLEQLREFYPQATVDEEGDLLGVARPGEAITIEPAAQIELSAGPFDDLQKAAKTFAAYRQMLDDMLAPKGMHVVAQGYHPTATARSLDLIPKRRYAFMNRYLSAKDIYGPCMMRGSASTQISIDYTSEQDCLRKMRIAYALTPILSLICDNSPVFEDKPRPHKLMRTDIWRHTDNDRCGLVPGALSSGFTFEDYAKYVLDTPAIVAPDENEGWRYCEQTFGQLYADKPMTQKQVDHARLHHTLDVRLTPPRVHDETLFGEYAQGFPGFSFHCAIEHDVQSTGHPLTGNAPLLRSRLAPPRQTARITLFNHGKQRFPVAAQQGILQRWHLLSRHRLRIPEQIRTQHGQPPAREIRHRRNP